jgi:aflatoxin B1 aldehyde reductase
MKAVVPRLYLGTMTFGWSQTSSRVNEPIALVMLERFMAHNRVVGEDDVHRVDTARIYAGGKTEPIVGTVISKLGESNESKILVGTKAHPSQPGGLSQDGIRSQHQASLVALDLDSFDEYYLHQPDTQHSLLESLQCLHEMVTNGLIRSIGMSNYHASEVARAFELCAEHNLTPLGWQTHRPRKRCKGKVQEQ